MGLLKCLSPRSHSMKEKELRSELRQVKAQLAEAKVTIADLKQGAALKGTNSSSDGRIGCASPTKQCLDVGIQAKPPIECESRIPRPDDGTTIKAGLATGPRVSITDLGAGTQTAGACSIPVSPGSLKSSQWGLRSPPARVPSPTRGPAIRSRIPASPSPDFVRRSQSCKNSSAGAAAAAAAATDSSEPALKSPREVSANELAASSNQARADFLANQLKVADAFRQSLEAELREARYKTSALQTQVLTLQTKLEKSVEAQVDEIDRLEQLRKRAGSVDSRGYEEALAELAQLKRRLEECEADRTVAEQQAQAATEMASTNKEALAATQEELATVKSELASAQARLLELTAEGAGLKQQMLKASKAQQRAEELEAALYASKASAAAMEAEYKDRVSKLEEEVRTQKAISESTCEELLALSASHSELKQCYHKMECESKQHDQLVHIVQQELAEMSYFAAAGRVALGLCTPEDAPMVTGAVLVTPSHSGCVSPQLLTGTTQTAAPSASTSAPQDEAAPLEQQASRNSKLVEDTTAVCIAAAAAAGAAAAIAANPAHPVSPRVSAAPAVGASEPGHVGSSAASSSRVLTAVSPRLLNLKPSSFSADSLTTAGTPTATGQRPPGSRAGLSAAVGQEGLSEAGRTGTAEAEVGGAQDSRSQGVEDHQQQRQQSSGAGGAAAFLLDGAVDETGEQALPEAAADAAGDGFITGTVTADAGGPTAAAVDGLSDDAGMEASFTTKSQQQLVVAAAAAAGLAAEPSAVPSDEDDQEEQEVSASAGGLRSHQGSSPSSPEPCECQQHRKDKKCRKKKKKKSEKKKMEGH